jgi:hypothetical protein
VRLERRERSVWWKAEQQELKRFCHIPGIAGDARVSPGCACVGIGVSAGASRSAQTPIPRVSSEGVAMCKVKGVSAQLNSPMFGSFFVRNERNDVANSRKRLRSGWPMA